MWDTWMRRRINWLIWKIDFMFKTNIYRNSKTCWDVTVSVLVTNVITTTILTHQKSNPNPNHNHKNSNHLKKPCQTLHKISRRIMSVETKYWENSENVFTQYTFVFTWNTFHQNSQRIDTTFLRTDTWLMMARRLNKIHIKSPKVSKQ